MVSEPVWVPTPEAVDQLFLPLLLPSGNGAGETSYCSTENCERERVGLMWIERSQNILTTDSLLLCGIRWF